MNPKNPFFERNKTMDISSKTDNKVFIKIPLETGGFWQKEYLQNDLIETVVNDFKNENHVDVPQDYFEDWNFNHLLQMAKKVGMYMDKESHKADLIREARNYVHPNEQIKKMNFTLDDALQSVSMLSEIIDSFKRYGKYKIVRD